MVSEFPVMTPEFAERVRAFKEDFAKKYSDISKERTPQLDGNGRKIIDKKGDQDYIIEPYMRNQLDKYFPGWSLDPAAPLQFLGSEWVVGQVVLSIIDEHLLAFGINPPVRRFYGVDSVRVQYKRDMPHTPENIVDVGDNCQSAVTGAFKRAINRLTHIGDDVYGKRIEEEGAGSYEEVLMTTGDATSFGRWITDNKWNLQEILKILGVKSFSEVTDFREAFEKVKQAKGGGA